MAERNEQVAVPRWAWELATDAGHDPRDVARTMVTSDPRLRVSAGAIERVADGCAKLASVFDEVGMADLAEKARTCSGSAREFAVALSQAARTSP